MKRELVLALALLHASSSIAWAADVIVEDTGDAVTVDPVRFGWTGAYVGGVVGVSLGTNRWEERSVGAAADSDAWDGTLGGITLGYNYQMSNALVVGVEGDYSFGTVDANSQSLGGLQLRTRL